MLLSWVVPSQPTQLPDTLPHRRVAVGKGAEEILVTSDNVTALAALDISYRRPRGLDGSEHFMRMRRQRSRFQKSRSNLVRANGNGT